MWQNQEVLKLLLLFVFLLFRGLPFLLKSWVSVTQFGFFPKQWNSIIFSFLFILYLYIFFQKKKSKLGAFLAGALLAETNFRTQIEADIRPFRGLLLGLFFLATGTSIDTQVGRFFIKVFSFSAFIIWYFDLIFLSSN